MATNKVATVVLLDVGSLSSEHCGSETFFQKCQWSVLRIIQRKIFSCVADEIGVVIFGSEETENHLNHAFDVYRYSNIQEYTSMTVATWDLYEQVQSLKTTNVTNSNWLEGIEVALDYLKEQTRGKRFKDKQLVVLSNFAQKLKRDDGKLNLLAESIDLDNIKLIVIGVDLEEECKDKFLDWQLPGSIGLMFSLIDKVQNGVSLSFEEAEEDIKYYERKGKMGRFAKVNLDIGSNISIPIRWIKITLEPTRLRWVRKPSSPQAQDEELDDKESEHEIRYVMEIQKTSKFGDSQIILSYADVEAMKRESGPASCIMLGCVKRQRISRKMFVGNDIYAVVPEKKPNAQAMFSAFIDALIEADKYVLVRRVSVKNGKIRLGVLIPVSDQAGKMFYFIQLPFAEHALVVPEVIHPEPTNKDILDIFENLIDTMTIPDKPKDIPKKDPIFQLRCHILYLCETGQLNSDINNTPVPDYVQKLCDPYPELVEDALHYIDKLQEILPTNIDEKLLELDDGYVALKGPETSSSKSPTNGPDQVNEENMNWENAETEEWPEELKERYRTLNKNNAELPSIILKEEMLSKNKYDTNYISNSILRDHGRSEGEVSNKNADETNVDNDSAIEEMLQQRQSTDMDVDTEDMMQRMRAKLEK